MSSSEDNRSQSEAASSHSSRRSSSRRSSISSVRSSKDSDDGDFRNNNNRGGNNSDDNTSKTSTTKATSSDSDGGGNKLKTKLNSLDPGTVSLPMTPLPPLSKRGKIQPFSYFPEFLALADGKDKRGWYNAEKNPSGIVNFVVAENKSCYDMLKERLKRVDVGGENFPNELVGYGSFNGWIKLRQAFARVLEEFVFRNGLEIDPDRLVVMNGCTSTLVSLVTVISDGHLGKKKGSTPALVPTAPAKAPPPKRGGFPFFRSLRKSEPVQPIVTPDDNGFTGSKKILYMGPRFPGFRLHINDFAQCEAVLVEPGPERGPDKFPTIEKLQKVWETNGGSLNPDLNEVVAILVCNPGNPSGVSYPKEELLELVQWTRERPIYLLSDEIYAAGHWGRDVSKGNKKRTREFFSLSPYAHATFWGLSKDFGSSGMRTSVLYIPKPEVNQDITPNANAKPLLSALKKSDEMTINKKESDVAKTLLKVKIAATAINELKGEKTTNFDKEALKQYKQLNSLGSAAGDDLLFKGVSSRQWLHALPSIAQVVLQQLLSDRDFMEEYLEHCRDTMKEYSLMAQRRLRKMGIPFVEPDGAMFLWINLGEVTKNSPTTYKSMDSLSLYKLLVKDYGVFLTPGADFHEGDLAQETCWMRLCFGACGGETGLERGLDQLEKFVEDVEHDTKEIEASATLVQTVYRERLKSKRRNTRVAPC